MTCRWTSAGPTEEGLEVSFKKTTWIASSPEVEAALKKQAKDSPVQVSTVAKDLGVANAAGRARRVQVQAKRLRKGAARGCKLHSLKVARTAHRVRVSKMGCLSASIWGHQGLGLSPKQLRGPRTHAAQAGRRQKLGSVDVVFSLGEGNCCDPLRTVVLQHWRTLHRLLFVKELPDKYQRLWELTWSKLARAPKRWALVKGPVAAMIAYLQDHGVNASNVQEWKFPPGSLGGTGLWNFGEAITMQPGPSLAFRVEEGLSRLLQHAANQRIAKQDAGDGAADGIDWTVPKPQTKQPGQLVGLRAVWQGVNAPCARNQQGCDTSSSSASGGKDAPSLNSEQARPQMSGIWSSALKVLPAGCSVVQGEAFALALLLRHTTGLIDVTADCKPAILQAQSSGFKAAHANIWEEAWEERQRLSITWHPSHREPAEHLERYGDPRHWRVKINDLADQACKAAAAAVDELVEEVSLFLAKRAWLLLAGSEAPPLDLKPRNAPRANLPPKPRAQQTSVCTLFIQQTHAPEIFSRLEAMPCAHRCQQGAQKEAVLLGAEVAGHEAPESTGDTQAVPTAPGQKPESGLGQAEVVVTTPPASPAQAPPQCPLAALAGDQGLATGATDRALSPTSPADNLGAEAAAPAVEPAPEAATEPAAEQGAATPARSDRTSWSPHGYECHPDDRCRGLQGRERADAPRLEHASLHSSPSVALAHTATLGSVLPAGVQTLLLREGTGSAPASGTGRERRALPSLFSPDQLWCYCCGIGVAEPLLMQAHAMTDRHVWNARVYVRRHREGHPAP
ncbi:unnamed protein product [Symbiodinium sp. CCMP2456]|nr:unnamed protein product [Symbiodinium sp. CCMP2456]